MNTIETCPFQKKLPAKISLAFLFDCLYFTMWSFSERQCKYMHTVTNNITVALNKQAFAGLSESFEVDS